MSERRIIHLETVDSTNNYLKEHFTEFPNYTLVYADHQTQGRGREDRLWIDEEKDNILASILIKTINDIKYVPVITMVAGVAIHKVLSKYADLTIKWPNDILFMNRKLCGILCEAISYGDKIDSIIIGFGINVNQLIFDNSVVLKPTSLKAITGITFDIETLLGDIYLELTQAIHDFVYHDVFDYEYVNKHLYKIDCEAAYTKDNVRRYGFIKGVTKEGKLILVIDNHEEYVESGEIKLMR